MDSIIKKTDSKASLMIQKERLDILMDNLFKGLKTDFMNLNLDKMLSKVRLLISTIELRSIVKNLSIISEPVSAKRIYIVSSLFLQDCYKYVTQKTNTEILVYITGIEHENLFVLTRIIGFKMDKQSAVYARGEINSTHNALINLDESGHKLLAVFHNHVANGVSATFPSSIDTNNQDRLEKSGYSAISGIFSSDGYVRFFNNKDDFEILVYGKGADKYGDKIYRLELCKIFV